MADRGSPKISTEVDAFISGTLGFLDCIEGKSLEEEEIERLACAAVDAATLTITLLKTDETPRGVLEGIYELNAIMGEHMARQPRILNAQLREARQANKTAKTALGAALRREELKAQPHTSNTSVESREVSDAVEKLADSLINGYGKGARLAVQHIRSKFNDSIVKQETELQKLSDFAKGIRQPSAEDYFYAIGRTKAVDVLTSQRVMDFAKGIGPDVAKSYFYAIGRTKAVDVLTSQRVMDFAKGIGPDAAWRYFFAIASTNAVDVLTSQRVMDFAKGIGPDAAWLYFSAIRSTNAADVLTSQRVMDFANGIGPDAAWWYFSAIYSTNAVDVLTSQKVTTSQFAELARYLGDVNYFETVAEVKDPMLLERGAIAIAISSERNFDELIRYKGVIKSAVEYYGLLSKSLKNIGEMKNIEIAYDDEFCRSALAHIDKDSAIESVHRMAYAGYEMNRSGLVNIDFDVMFSRGRSRIAQYINEASAPAFAKLGVRESGTLRIEERLALVSNINYVKENHAELNSFIERRTSGIRQMSPFSGAAIKDGVISEKHLSESKALEIDPKTALETMVYVLNGSRDRANVDNARKLLVDSGYFGEKDIDAAFGRWASMKGPYQKPLAGEFARYRAGPSTENAKKVIDVFRNAVAEKDIVVKEPINDFIGKLEPLIMGDVRSISRGDRIVAYTDNKDGVITIKSSETGACCFVGGVNEHAALPYALDDGIALVNFTVTDSGMSMEMLKKRKVQGVAICAFARMDKGKKPVLLVDSFEGGITLDNALNGDYGIVVDALKRFAAGAGCGAVAINTRTNNPTPKKFAAYVKEPEETHSFELLTKEEQYLEARLPSANVKMIEVKASGVKTETPIAATRRT